MASKPPPEPIYVLRGASAAITVLKFAPKSVSTEGILLSGSTKGILNLWNLKTKRIWMTLDSHDGKGVLAAHFLPGGTIISHGRDGHLKFLQCSEGRSEDICSMQAPSLGFCQFDILTRGHDSHLIAVPSSEQSQVNILDLESKKPICSLIPEKEKSVGMCMCLSLFASPITHKPFLAAGYENGSVMVWDVTAEKVLSNSLVHTESVLCMDVDQKNLHLITGSADNKLCVSSAVTESGVSFTRHVELKNPGIASVKIRKDRKIAATGGWDGRVRIYGWKKLSPLAYLSYHTGTINSVDFSDNLPDTGQILAAGGKDTRISLWSLYNNTPKNE